MRVVVAMTGATLIGFAVVNAIPFSPFSLTTDPWQIVYMLVTFLAVAAPFACAGFIAALLLHRPPRHAGSIYCFDLLGAGIGAISFVFVVPSLGGPLLGVALGRWVRFPGAAFVLFLVIFGWVELVTILTFSRPDSAPIAVLRLFSPFAFFTDQADSGAVMAWRGSPWFFIGWQLALCAIAVLVALLRGAEGPVRTRVIRALAITGAAAVILLMLAATGGFTHAVAA